MEPGQNTTILAQDEILMILMLIASKLGVGGIYRILVDINKSPMPQRPVGTKLQSSRATKTRIYMYQGIRVWKPSGYLSAIDQRNESTNLDIKG